MYQKRIGQQHFRLEHNSYLMTASVLTWLLQLLSSLGSPMTQLKPSAWAQKLLTSRTIYSLVLQIAQRKNMLSLLLIVPIQIHTLSPLRGTKQGGKLLLKQSKQRRAACCRNHFRFRSRSYYDRKIKTSYHAQLVLQQAKIHRIKLSPLDWIPIQHFKVVWASL